MYFPRAALALLPVAILLGGCGPSSPPTSPPGPQDAPPPQTDTPGEEKPKSGFLSLRPPGPAGERPAEALPPPAPRIPKLVVAIEGERLPESWLEEWKAGRTLAIEQIPAPAAGTAPTPDIDVWIVTPARLGPLLESQTLLELGSELGPPTASPLFTGHPYDPSGRFTRPFRWTPYVLHRRRAAADGAFPGFAITWKPEDAILWPQESPSVRGLWNKTRGLSANDADNASSWTPIAAALSGHMKPPADIWKAFTAGDANRCWLPAARRFHLPADEATRALYDVVIPACGTLIHFENLAISAQTPVRTEALDLVRWLTDPARQARIASETGHLPVNRPLGREHEGATPPLPPGDWLDKSEFILPAYQAPAAPTPNPAAVPGESTGPSETGPEPGKTPAPDPAPAAPESPAHAPAEDAGAPN